MRRIHADRLAALIGLGLGLTLAATPLLADPRCGPTAAVRVGVAPPPPLPETSQPPMPAYGYAWTPGYWGWNTEVNDYYWTPGAWAAPPAIGLLWTPGFWGWSGGVYVFNAGYWGAHVGFYGGVRYGFGYWGHGYDGGYWRGRTFYYNRAYDNLGALRINAVYERRVAADRLVGRVSYNGGRGGVSATPNAEELAASREAHVAATAEQARHVQTASADPALRASVNRGQPEHGGSAASSAGRPAATTHGSHGHLTASHAANHAHRTSVSHHGGAPRSRDHAGPARSMHFEGRHPAAIHSSPHGGPGHGGQGGHPHDTRAGR